MRSYEVMIILDPEVDDRQVQPMIDNHLKPVIKAGGVVTNIDIMGRRRFAYEIAKKAEGTYVVVNLDAEPPVVKEFDRKLSIDESVLRAKVFRPEPKTKEMSVDPVTMGSKTSKTSSKD